MTADLPGEETEEVTGANNTEDSFMNLIPEGETAADEHPRKRKRYQEECV